MEYTKVHKKIKAIGEHLIRKKDFWLKKKLVYMFFLSALNI
jgi:hypothetical protein